MTTQRTVIAEVFFHGGKHLSLNEIHALARKRKPSIGYATVYRTMRLLVEGGLAEEHRFGENQTRYEPDLEGEHHDHLICVECGVIVEFEDEAVESRQEVIAKQHGFTVVNHRHEVYVKCLPSHCRKDEASGVRVGVD